MIATPPHPDPAPIAFALHRKATVSGSYWIDVFAYVGEHRVGGVMGRCHMVVGRANRCFIIRVGAR